MESYFFSRPMPDGLEELTELALDLRWTWSHFSDRLWEYLDPETWERSGNPYFLLESVAQSRLEEAAHDPSFKADLCDWVAQRQAYLGDPGWFGRVRARTDLEGIAYFSMEFGLGDALPLYSGGLGILAGDYLKTASDLGVPVVGIGLLYQQGYFRQILAPDGWQVEAFPYSDPTSLPVMPVRNRDGGWLRVPVSLPGRTLLLRVWLARVGKVNLYLLDSNDLLNSPTDRGVTAHLYPAGQRPRLTQEIILGIGGWRLLEELGLRVDVCHLNEGHAAFVVLARALSVMRRSGCSFAVALCATRAGNVFTTHTPVEAAFDRFEPALLWPYAQSLASQLGITVEQFLALGRRDLYNQAEPFTMAFLAMRGSGVVNGVSRLHGLVSRRIFQVLYPDWPEVEVPVSSVTNGVHVPSWDSQDADALWTRACGKQRWSGSLDELCGAIEQVTDAELWSFRASQRHSLIRHVRRRLARQMEEHGAPPDAIQRARQALDSNRLTFGFARRFAEYKRPALLLHDAERFARLLRNPELPVQLIVAGKAHFADDEGKCLVQAMAKFAGRPDLCDHVVFLEDYDIALAQTLVMGIDVWINTPRRPWEACGTSGMKVLVNGGLNLSELDGWWSEAYASDVGWALGDGHEHMEPAWDSREATQLYEILEQEVIPEFYARDREGIPSAWLRRIRTSMSRLTPLFSSTRMLHEYVEKAYLPAAKAYRRRMADGAKLAGELHVWHEKICENWRGLRFGDVRVSQAGECWRFEAQVYCGELDPSFVQVELYADPITERDGPTHAVTTCQGPIPGAVNGYHFIGEVPATRPAYHYTPRIIPYHPQASIPLEETHILWKR